MTKGDQRYSLKKLDSSLANNESIIGRAASTEVIRLRLKNLTQDNNHLEAELDTGDLNTITRASFQVTLRVAELQRELSGFQARNPNYQAPFLDDIKKQFDTANSLHHEVKTRQNHVIKSLEITLSTILAHISSEGGHKKDWTWKKRFIDATKDPHQTQKIKMLENVQQFVASTNNREWLSNTRNLELLAGIVKSICELERTSVIRVTKSRTHSLDEFMTLYSNQNPMIPVALDDALKRILTEDNIDKDELDRQLNHRSDKGAHSLD